MIADTQVAEKTQIDLKKVRDYMDLFAAEGALVDGNDSGGHAGALTAQGRIALGERFSYSTTRPSLDSLMNFAAAALR
jgi:hypothetical protein